MAETWSRSLYNFCVCALIRESFFFLPFPLSLPLLKVLFWWSFFQWQASGLYAATVISSSAHTKWPPTANIIKWQHMKTFHPAGVYEKKQNKKKMLYSNNLLITHCILSHRCITFHSKIEFSFVQKTMQRSFITTWLWYIYKFFFSNVFSKDIPELCNNHRNGVLFSI